MPVFKEIRKPYDYHGAHGRTTQLLGFPRNYHKESTRHAA